MPETSAPQYPAQGEHLMKNAKRDLLPSGYTPSEAVMLFVHAHPDDETTATGATMAYYAKKGAKVHLLTLTRGEMGEVIPPKLQHLEVGKPGNSDNGEALGEYRTVELNNATAKLGVRKRFFLGEEPATAPGALNIYRDSGMAWGKDGKPVANPKASEDSLTAQPIAPQAEAIANAIRDIKPDVLITYDLDGGYGHPDHVRTHQAVLEALKILGDSNDRPILTWGIEGEFSEQDARQQCAITGSVEAKREAMKAHGTQIVVTGDTTFEFSNKVEQKISAVETYRLLDGNAQRKIPETPTQAGIVSLLITCILLGTLAGIAGSICPAWVMYTGETPLPVGLVFGFATVFFASLWASLALRRGGATVITGAFAFLVIYALAFMRPDSPFVLVNPDYPPIGLYGTLWLLGTPVISLLAFFVFTRTKEGNAFYNTPRQVHLRHRRAEEKARRAQTLNNSSRTAP